MDSTAVIPKQALDDDDAECGQRSHGVNQLFALPSLRVEMSDRAHKTKRKCLSKNGLLLRMARLRARSFRLLSIPAVILTIAWLIVRYYLVREGEDQVSLNGFDKLAVSVKNTIERELEKDLVYQNQVANLWAINPNITRDEFRQFTMSDFYRLGSDIIAGMSLIPRVVGAEARQRLESGAQEEELRRRCCANASDTGSACAAVAGTGLFCSGSQGYGFTQFGPNGLVPADGSSQEYLDRVGQEEYMVVHMIEPFESNAKVWGFNLLSSDARLRAWRSAMASGLRTFTRRLKLVQGSGSEYGVLVWLPLFADAAGKWTSGFRGAAENLTAVGSVNSVYFLQELVTKSIEGTYSPDQLADVSILLYDDAVELNGEPQFLAAYGVENAFERFGGSVPMSAAIDDGCTYYKAIDLDLEMTDLRWKVIVAMRGNYLVHRRSLMPEITTFIGIFVVLVSFVDRALGSPFLTLLSLGKRKPANVDGNRNTYIEEWLGRRLSFISMDSLSSANGSVAGDDGADDEPGRSPSGAADAEQPSTVEVLVAGEAPGEMSSVLPCAVDRVVEEELS